jgi:hypothetical protein
MIIFIESTTAVQLPLEVEVKYKVTDPEVISFEDGTYVAAGVIAFGKKFPEPEVVHIPPPAVVIVPFNLIPEVSAQTVRSAPAFTVGAGVMVNVT